ncbi:OmpH family outer membrane protein [Mucilaginibacter flavus]|uniref:OmpH family outer membrane protein n=1 Tax=Mucilaginibacter flavus TaxID=931504 RepID=UPI0025B28778|nr:OmpH family outer membrane protein [Mucilaginibacter flavus]MDN3583674.1 OmpH family outer membrane protein [Mucilaginibacter flavus]
MKRSILVLFVSLSLILAGNVAKAQAKIGYIDFQALLGQMPEAKGVKAQIDTYQKQFVDQLTAMNNELQTKGQEYQSQSAKMTDAARIAKETELQDIQKRMEDLQNSARQQVEAKSNELVKPLSDKAIAALNAIAKETGLSYVIDSSQGTQVIVSPDGTDLMNAAKAKLGIK